MQRFSRASDLSLQVVTLFLLLLLTCIVLLGCGLWIFRQFPDLA